ncbi:MAG: hypothetical protein Q8K93_17715 [Reyranella sp.]|uniref:hypothetical protein n=1 Tax=Reyranella sp. TaxID=1929291 RepID=UPI00272EFD2E|nr:hypothetical protein [Reyranella sp.]MDP1964029.1 hypothetical protein [Reyranella sp.]MDP2373652.1 hypothetical protein [Reyranella sp.]
MTRSLKSLRPGHTPEQDQRRCRREADRIDPEDQKLIDAASCEEIVREYRNYSAAEKEAEAQIRQSIAEGARKKGCNLRR